MVKNEEIKHEAGQDYEIGYLLTPLVPADNLAAVVSESIKQAVTAAQGVITSELEPRQTPLAHEVAKTINHKRSVFREAYFGALRFKLEPGKLPEFNQALKNQSEILRFLIITLPKDAANIIPLKRAPLAPLSRRRAPSAVKTEKEVEGEEAPKVEMTKEAIDKEIDGLLVETA